MKFRGAYDAGEQYDVGDVIGYQGEFWCAFEAPPAGTPPTVTLYWERAPRLVEIAAQFAIDVLGIVNSKISETEEMINSRITEDAIALKGTGEDSADYLITVDESGDTPELVVTEVSDEGEGT